MSELTAYKELASRFKKSSYTTTSYRFSSSCSPESCFIILVKLLTFAMHSSYYVLSSSIFWPYIGGLLIYYINIAFIYKWPISHQLGTPALRWCWFCAFWDSFPRFSICLPIIPISLSQVASDTRMFLQGFWEHRDSISLIIGPWLNYSNFTQKITRI